MTGPFDYTLALVQADPLKREAFASRLYPLHAGAVLEGPEPGDDPNSVARRLHAAGGTPNTIIVLDTNDSFTWHVVQELIWNGWLAPRATLLLDQPLTEFTSLDAEQLRQLGFSIVDAAEFDPKDSVQSPLNAVPPSKLLVAEARRILAGEARAKFEKESNALRVLFDAARSAVRLLTGAFAHRQVEPREFDHALTQIAGAAKVDGHFTNFRESLAAHLNFAGVESSARLRNLDPSRGVLVVVAEPTLHGWREFFESVFEAHRVVVVSPAESEEYFAESDDFAIAFHDLSDGDDAEERVRIVERISREHFDLPLVVFSPRDDFREMRRYLRAGAAGFFCYETGEDAQVSFQQFEGVVREAIPEQWVRQLWQELRSFTGPLEHSTGRRLYRRALGHMRQAYFFLTADLTDPRLRLLRSFDVRQGLNPEGLARHGAIACGTALETVVRHLCRENWDQFDQQEVNLLDGDDRIQTLLALLAAEGYLTGDLLVRGQRVWRLRNLAAHDSRGGTIDPARARRAFSDAILVLDALFAQPPDEDFPDYDDPV